MSLYYSYDLIARAGDLDTIALTDSPSINDAGRVSFVGTFSDGQGLFVGDGTPDSLRNINPTFSHSPTRTFPRFSQINNNDQVASIDRVSGGPPLSRMRIWDANGTDAFEVVGSAGTTQSPVNDPWDAILSSSTIDDAGDTAFGALLGNVSSFNFHGAGDPRNDVDELVTSQRTQLFRPMMSDDGHVVVEVVQPNVTSIVLYDGVGGQATTIADTSTFQSLGTSPGISADGSIVVFAGDRGDGPGVFASVDDGGGTRRLIRVAGEDQGPGGPHDELGRDMLPDAQGNPQGDPLYFSAFEINSRVAVWHQRNGMVSAGDSFVVSFLATPNSASPASPYKGVPFTAAPGLWTVQVYADAPISGNGPLDFAPNVAIPVVQVGDVIAGSTVDSISVFDPLGGATRDRAGAPRTSTQGDHMVAFSASTSAGTMIVRANHFDVSAAQLRTIAGTRRLSQADADHFVNAANRAMTEFGIVSPRRQAAFLSQLLAEGFTDADWEENYTLRPDFQLPGVSRPPHTATSQEDYFNYWYSNRVGNGDYASDDGFNYRGRGPIQLTGRTNYARLGTGLGLDLIGNPDLVADREDHPEIAFRVAGYFFSTQRLALNSRGGRALVQRSSLTRAQLSGTIAEIADLVNPNAARSVSDVNEAITFGINGGFNGLAARLGYYRRALRTLLP